jgi:tetraacyldisaccharide 4'-kinase
VRAVLPRGLLREPPDALARADLLVVTRSDLVAAAELARIEAELDSFAPGKPVLLATHRSEALRDPRGARAPLELLAGREVDLVSGLGNPEGFERSMVRLGARVRTHRRFPDHHAFRPSDLDGLGGAGRWVVTTAKDAVKLPAERVYVLLVEFELTRGSGILEAMLDALPRGQRLRERSALHEGLHG